MQTDAFENRHIGPNKQEQKKILKTIGVDSMSHLLELTLPPSIHLPHPLNLPKGISEHAFAQEMQMLSEKNELYDTYIGLGYNSTITPAVIQRNIFENPGWYTAYTPYQAEIAQGRLEALFNFNSERYKGGFIFKNSWGYEWGTNGYSWITFDYINKYLYEACQYIN